MFILEIKIYSKISAIADNFQIKIYSEISVIADTFQAMPYATVMIKTSFLTYKFSYKRIALSKYIKTEIQNLTTPMFSSFQIYKQGLPHIHQNA